jgi:hypothetical protein
MAAYEVNRRVDVVFVNSDINFIVNDARRFRVESGNAAKLLPLIAQLQPLGPRSKADILADIASSCGSLSASETVFSQLYQADILVLENSGMPSSVSDGAVHRRLLSSAEPIDYATNIRDNVDTPTMRSYLQETDMPPQQRIEQGRPKSTSSALARVVLFVHAIRRQEFYGPLPRSRRVVPSFGASHPADVFVGPRDQSTKGSSSFNRSLPFEYVDPVSVEGCEQLNFSELVVDSASLDGCVEIRGADHRTQWRYRSSFAYPWYCYDIGHLMECIKGVLIAQGCRVESYQNGSECVACDSDNFPGYSVGHMQVSSSR